MHSATVTAPSFDYRAFIGRQALQHTTPVRHPQQYGGDRGMPSNVVLIRERASAAWLVKLHIAAARRWLAGSPVRLDQVEATLSSIGDALGALHPGLGRDLVETSSLLSRQPGLSELLDRIEADLPRDLR